ncbi:MAG: ferritin [Prolixibacteraceae bacterium]|jgi:ferritin|nr:ferritin [Prolixibacteraceae bacterium]
MLKEKMEKALNEQINKELYSAYLYYSMSAYSESIGMPGIANWMKIQAQEELTHANKFFAYIHERDGKVTLTAIDAVDTEFGNVKEMFDKVLAHEQFISDSINKLVDISIELSDHASRSMLMWFVDEQVEEEANVQEILDQLAMFDAKGHGLFMLDKDLGSRTFVDATASGK